MLLDRLSADAGTKADRETITAETPAERSVYSPPISSRFFGFVGTSAIFALVVAGFLLTLARFVPMETVPTLTVVNLRPAASPPETPPKENEAPEPIEKKDTPPDETKVEPMERPTLLIATRTMPKPMPSPTVDPAPMVAEAAAPRTQPAPPAPQVASNAPDSWEGRVLVQLAAHRRYPGFAASRKQQGVPYIRFVIDREGKVLSSRLERSSGFPDLDREAVSLPKRAAPLPKPPNDRLGNTIELVVPVEFFLR